MRREQLSQSDHPSSAGSILSPIARSLMTQSFRPNTRRAYAMQISGWLRWRGHPQFEPCDPIAVANYIAELASAGRSLSTLRMVVAALKAAHDAHGWRFESAHPVPSHVLRGAANASSVLPRQAEPLRGDVLLDILQSIASDPTDLRARRDSAILAVGYLFALRRSEIVGLDLQEQVTGDEKSWGVLRLCHKTIEVVLSQSKTSKGIPERVSVPRENNAEAVGAIEAWISAASIKARQPLFWSFLKGGKLRKRLSDQTVSAIVKSRVEEHIFQRRRALGESLSLADEARMSGHSLRVGFVVTAAEAGADLRAIARVTRHKSLTVLTRYAVQADQLRTSPHQLPGVGLEAAKKEK